MVVIEFRYKPIGFLSFTRKYKTEVPESWNEMAMKHLLCLSKVYCNFIDERQFIQQYIGMKRWIVKRINIVDIYYIAKQLQFVNDRNALDHFIIPQINIGKKKYYTPKPLMKGVTFGDFVYFDSAFMEYDQESVKLLDKFIGALMKCETPERIHYHIKYAIALNYSMVREWLSLRYTHLFQKSKKKTDNSKKGNNWLPIFDILIKDDLANSDKFENLPLHTVLRKLNNDIKESYRNVKI